MKRVLNLFLAVAMTVQASLSFAQDGSGGGGEAVGDSNMSYTTDSNAIATATGGREQDTTDERIGPRIVRAQWAQDQFNPAANPVVASLLGQSAVEITEESLAQSFGDLLTTNPLALFLDLNGNGVSGDMWDGLLFNLFWGASYNNTYTTSNFQNGVQTRFRMTAQQPNAEILRAKISDKTVLLTSELTDGRRAASLKDLVDLVKSESNNRIRTDQKIALSTLTLLALVNPLATTAYGPFLRHFSPSVQEIAANIRSEMKAAFTAVNFHVGGNRLAFDSSVNRLATICAMIEGFEMRQPFIGLEREETLLALRGALYFMAFEIKRLNIRGGARDEIFKTLMKTLAEYAPRTMMLAANRATTPEEMVNLTDIVRHVGVINLPHSSRRNLRVAASTVSAGVALLLWMNGAVPTILSSAPGSFGGVAASAIGGVAAFSAAASLANWLLKPKRVDVLDPGVKAFYESMVCEKELSY